MRNGPFLQSTHVSRHDFQRGPNSWKRGGETRARSPLMTTRLNRRRMDADDSLGANPLTRAPLVSRFHSGNRRSSNKKIIDRIPRSYDQRERERGRNREREGTFTFVRRGERARNKQWPVERALLLRATTRQGRRSIFMGYRVC